MAGSVDFSNTSVAPTRMIVALYAVFLTVCLYIYFVMAEMHTSSIYTFSSMAHCFAILLLACQGVHDCFKASPAKDVAACAPKSRRVSGFGLILSVLALSCRLASTSWLYGYVPMDPSGDWFYQALDVVGIAVAVPLLLLVLFAERWRDGKKCSWKDLLCFTFTLGGTAVTAAYLHGDMNDRPLYDTLWMAGALFGILAVIPQLWKSCQADEEDAQKPLQGRPQAHHFDHHAIVALCFSQMMSFTYLWMARYDVAYKVLIEDFNHPVYLLLAAHALALRVVCDFHIDLSTEQ